MSACDVLMQSWRLSPQCAYFLFKYFPRLISDDTNYKSMFLSKTLCKEFVIVQEGSLIHKESQQRGNKPSDTAPKMCTQEAAHDTIRTHNNMLHKWN
jgi:hypothetical protein